MLHVIVTNRDTGKKQQYKFVQHSVIIGRQPNCDVVLDSTHVSRQHAKISVNRDLVEAEDLGSGNGTILNHKKLTPNKKIPIKKGDRLRVENFEIEAEWRGSSNPLDKLANPDITDPDIIEIKMIKKVLGALDQDKMPSLVVVTEEFSDKKAVFEEGKEELVVGRDEKCELFIDSGVISRKHAVIKVKWGQYVVIDQQSKNGTFVNGRRVEEKSIKDGDEIVFGTIKTIFKNPQEFNIDAITKSLTEEKKSEQAQQQAQAVSSAVPSEAAQTSLSEAVQKDVSLSLQDLDHLDTKQPLTQKKSGEKTDQKSKTKESVLNKAAENMSSSDSQQEHNKDNKANLAKADSKKIQSKLTATELLLFVFGGLVIFVVVIVLIMLFI